jgi:hypothetical protein
MTLTESTNDFNSYFNLSPGFPKEAIEVSNVAVDEAGDDSRVKESV